MQEVDNRVAKLESRRVHKRMSDVDSRVT